MNDPSAESAANEADSIPLRASLVVAAVAVAVTVLAVAWSWTMAAAQVPRSRVQTPATTEVAGVLQSLFDEPGRAAVVAARQRAVRDSYAWVDRVHGVARVPVAVAMTLYLDKRRH